jgi:hypothetical protein
MGQFSVKIPRLKGQFSAALNTSPLLIVWRFRLAPGQTAAGLFCWWRAGSSRRSSPGCGRGG